MYVNIVFINQREASNINFLIHSNLLRLKKFTETIKLTKAFLYIFNKIVLKYQSKIRIKYYLYMIKLDQTSLFIGLFIEILLRLEVCPILLSIHCGITREESEKFFNYSKLS